MFHIFFKLSGKIQVFVYLLRFFFFAEVQHLLLFCLVSLFNGQSILSNDKAILVNGMWWYLTHSWRMKGVNTIFPNVLVWKCWNSSTRVRTPLFRGHSPAWYLLFLWDHIIRCLLVIILKINKILSMFILNNQCLNTISYTLLLPC